MEVFGRSKTRDRKIMKKFETLRVGDIVWTVQMGWTLVTGISTLENDNYPIKTDGFSYTLDGRHGIRDRFKSLFFDNQFFEPRWLMVSSDTIEWKKRFVIAVNNDEFIAEVGGTISSIDSESCRHFSSFKYAREIPVKRKLTLKEIADKFGEDIDNIEIV